MKKIATMIGFLFMVTGSVHQVLANTNQGHFRWRNDDGSETAATWRQPENTNDTLTAASKIRLRIELYDNTPVTLSSSFGLAYSTDNVTFTSISTDSSSNAWALAASSYFSDADPTTHQLSTTTGSYSSGGVMVSQTSIVGSSLNSGDGTEYEFCVVPTSHAVDGTLYYFELLPSVGSVDYDQIPTLLYVTSPKAIVDAASEITSRTAKFVGHVFPNTASTSVRFEYGVSPGIFTHSIDASPATVNGSTFTTVVATPTDLVPGYKYYYRLSCSSTSPANTFVSNVQNFLTPYENAGNGVKLNGSTDYISMANPISGSAMTIEAWIYPTGSTSSERVVDNISPGGSDGYLLDILSGAPRFIVGADAITAADPLPVLNTWYHLAATYDGVEMNLYVNGNLVGSAPNSDGIPSNSYPMLVGVNQDGSGDFFSGEIDELSIWNTALDSTQIRQTMHHKLNGDETGLRGYWQFDENTGTEAHDKTVDGYTALLAITSGGGGGWVTSTAPVGIGSTDHSGMTSGSSPISTTSDMSWDGTTGAFTNDVDLFFTEINTSPNVMPAGSAANLTGRYWIVTPFSADPGAFSTSLSFRVPTWFTRNGSEDAGTYILYQRDATSEGAWNPLVTGASRVGVDSVSFDNVSTNGQFMIGSSDVSLDVQATDFLAKTDAGSVTITWKTRSEVNNAGFNVLRQDPGSAAFKLIANYSSESSLRGLGTSTIGKNYSFTDKKVKSGSLYQYKIQSVSIGGTASDLTTVQVKVDVPNEYALYQNYPNPFNPSTTFRFDLKKQSNVKIEIFNTLGQRVEELNFGTMDAGRYDKLVNLNKFASGIYYYRISAVAGDGEHYVSVKKLVLMK